MKEGRLGEFVDFAYGKGLPARNRKSGSVPVFGSAGCIDTHNEALVEGPGVIIGRKGTVGAVYWSESDFYPIDTTYYLVPKSDGFHWRYLYYLLSTLPLRDMNTDVAVPGLNRTNALRLHVKIASPPTQCRIADILSAYDDLIENNRRRIQLLEEAARLLYREWFVHLRFPGHEHVAVVDGVPEGWEKKTLGEVAATNAGSYRANSLPDTINYVDITSVTQGRILTKTQMPSADAPGRARRKAVSGDVIWSNVRPNLRGFALVLDPEENDVFSTGFTVLTPTAVPFSYLYPLVTTDEFVGHLVNHTTGASYPAVRPDDFQRAVAIVPSQRILDLFHEKTEPVFKLIAVLARENKALVSARDLLLPRLMNGEISI